MWKSLCQVGGKRVHLVACRPDAGSVCHLPVLLGLALLHYHSSRLHCLDLQRWNSSASLAVGHQGQTDPLWCSRLCKVIDWMARLHRTCSLPSLLLPVETYSAVQHQLDATSAEVIGCIGSNLPVEGTEDVVMSVDELHGGFLLCHIHPKVKKEERGVH